MSRQIKAGSTDQSVVISIIDSTDGSPETAVEYDTAGIDLWYRREGAAKVPIVEAALAALTTAHTDGGIEHIGDGEYRLDLPDEAVATGATGVQIGGTVTGMLVYGPYIELVAYDPYDSTRLGLSALPNAAPDAAGGLPISDAGGLDLDAKIGALTFTTANKVDCRVDNWAGQAVTLSTNNKPDVNVDEWHDVLLATTNPLPNAAPDAAGGLPISDAGSLDLDTLLGRLDAAISTRSAPSDNATALTNIGLDHLVSTSVTGTDVADNSIIAKLVSKSATADWDSFTNTTDALEALRDQGDAGGWSGAGGVSDILGVIPMIPQDNIDLADTAQWRLGLMLTNMVDDLPNASTEITPGDISISRKAIGGTSWTSVRSAVPCSEIDGLIYYDETFSAGNGYAEGDSIRITFANQKITVSANDYEITGATGRMFYTSIRQTMRGTDSAFLAASAPTNFSDLAITASTGRVDINANNDKTGYSISGTITTLDGLNNFDPTSDTVDVGKINGNAVAASNLSYSARGMLYFTAQTGTLSSTQATTNLSQTRDDLLIGRTILWLTGNQAYEMTSITDYDGTTKLLTFQEITGAPSNGDTGVIL